MLSRTVDTRVRALAIATLIGQILIVGTGGAVRLTGSGLGCPTWPQCTEGSFVSTPEMGIHGAIEFGNRLLTFVLVIIAILTFLSIVRLRRERRDLFVLALVVGLAIPVQAVIGGITVLTNLNPFVVGLHFLASVVMVVIATVYLYRVLTGPGGGAHRVPALFALLVYLSSLTVAVTIVVGVLTTGSGPHAGDGGAARNGLDPEVMQHVHSWPGYVMLAVTAIVAARAVVGVPVARFPAVVLLALQLAQIAVGITQSRLGLPEVLVGSHMVLACCAAAAATWLVLTLRTPAAAGELRRAVPAQA